MQVDMTIDRIRTRANEMGLCLSFFCETLGLSRVDFNDVEESHRDIPQDRLELIAKLLQTTPDYLLGNTDIKEKAPDQNDQVRDENIVRILKGDGTYLEKCLTDEQITALEMIIQQLPEVHDI